MPFYLGGFLFLFDALTSWDLADPGGTVAARAESESESEVVQSIGLLATPWDCSPPGSSVHGIFQERVLEWVAISFSRGSSQTRD